MSCGQSSEVLVGSRLEQERTFLPAVFIYRPPHSAHVLAGSGDNSICIFEEQASASADVDPQQKPSFQLAVRLKDAHTTDINCVRWHPIDPTLLASAGDDGSIKLWRYHSSVKDRPPATPTDMEQNGSCC